MKKMLLIGTVTLALAACADGSDETVAANDVAANDMVETMPVDEAAWTGFEPGQYKVESDGQTVDYTLNEDGTFSMTDGSGETTTGTLAMVDGKGCFTATGESEAMCWTNAAPGADGSWQATSDAGETAVVMRVEG